MALACTATALEHESSAHGSTKPVDIRSLRLRIPVVYGLARSVRVSFGKVIECIRSMYVGTEL